MTQRVKFLSVCLLMFLFLGMIAYAFSVYQERNKPRRIIKNTQKKVTPTIMPTPTPTSIQSVQRIVPTPTTAAALLQKPAVDAGSSAQQITALKNNHTGSSQPTVIPQTSATETVTPTQPIAEAEAIHEEEENEEIVDTDKVLQRVLSLL